MQAMAAMYICTVTFLFLLLIRDSRQKNDPCSWQKNMAVRAMTGDCGAYWECIGGKSVSRCCAPGYGFGKSKDQFTCIQNKDLTIPCVNSFCATRLHTDILEEEDCMKNKKMDLVLLVDGSASITAKGFERLFSLIRTALKSLSDIVPRLVRVGLVIYDEDPFTLFSLGKFSKMTDILAALRNVKFRGGGTRTDLALNFIIDESFTPEAGDRENVENVLLVITDGKSNDPKETEIAANFVKLKEIHVFSMSIGEETNQKELATIVSDAIYRITEQFFVDIGPDFLSFLAQKICKKPLDCPVKQVDGCPHCFQPKGIQFMKDVQECPKDLYFSVKSCACEHAFGEEVSAINYCLPTLQLEVPQNQSVNFEALGFVMTRITQREVDGKPNDNYLEFNGRNSFINIIRLSNTYKVPQMLLSFDIKVGTFNKRKAHQTVFTNHLGKTCDNLLCEGSIQVLLVAQNRLRSIVITKAGKKISLETSISIGWNRVWLVYDGSFSRIFLVMTFERTDRDYTLKDTAHDHTDVSGPLAPRESGLLVGRPSSDRSGSYFNGGLTNIVFSHCLPEKIKQQLQFIFVD